MPWAPRTQFETDSMVCWSRMIATTIHVSPAALTLQRRRLPELPSRAGLDLRGRRRSTPVTPTDLGGSHSLTSASVATLLPLSGRRLQRPDGFPEAWHAVALSPRRKRPAHPGANGGQTAILREFPATGDRMHLSEPPTCYDREVGDARESRGREMGGLR
jgi:hypothetical protein